MRSLRFYQGKLPTHECHLDEMSGDGTETKKDEPHWKEALIVSFSNTFFHIIEFLVSVDLPNLRISFNFANLNLSILMPIFCLISFILGYHSQNAPSSRLLDFDGRPHSDSALLPSAAEQHSDLSFNGHLSVSIPFGDLFLSKLIHFQIHSPNGFQFYNGFADNRISVRHNNH